MSIVAEIIENYNKAEQKRLITEIMNEDAKDGLYNPKQTAVEWLLEKLEQSNLIDLDVVDSDRYYACIKQAKEMEREQLKSERLEGYVEGINSVSTHSPD